jgi:hypothetical protein
VTAIDARTLVSATASALEWSAPPLASRFPDYGEGCDGATCTQMQSFCNQGFCCTSYMAACQMNGVNPTDEVPFQRQVGIFLRNSERGFRGLDFQGRLAWQNRYGACTKPRWVTQDFVDRLHASAVADPAATTGELVAALKDRLVGEPAIDPGAETGALAAIAGALDAPASAITADTLRRVCGALVESPQFLLQGIAGRGGDRPRLTPANASFDAVCADLATSGLGVPGLIATCAPDAVTLAAGRVAPPAPPRIDVRGGARRLLRADPPSGRTTMR